ncbi:MAG: hypothetical protein IT369_18870, partial [Candidatus Latescibacteria bacterium]|nr:hypothetical protein [Candidatus Latescibacterota bacterium]
HWHTPSGSLVPRGAIADHLTFGGRPIFFPGTLDDYEGQGGRWGKLPSLDDHYYFIEMAWWLVMQHGEKDLLDTPVAGMPLIDRLDLAFGVPPSRPDTGLVWCDEHNRGVSFGFVDSIFHTGELLFCSLLKCRAAGQLAQLHQLRGAEEAARCYERIARTLNETIPATFADQEGWLRASTGKSSQPDVWGCALAVYAGLLDQATRQRLCALLCAAYTSGSLSWRGGIRHVPTGADHRRHSAWEETVSPYPKNRYQNGAYWSTPTGWVCFALAQVSPRIARRLALELIATLREGDFRQGAAWGAPFECAHPEGDHQQNPVYLTSVTCPLAAFRRLGWVD